MKIKNISVWVGLFFMLSGVVNGGVIYAIASNKITTVGNATFCTEAVPCKFHNLYLADKAGSVNLWSGTPVMNIVLSHQIQPSDEVSLKIDFVLSGTNAGAGDTIVITGTDKDDNAQLETLATASDGTYTTTKWFKTITDVDCNGFNSGNLIIKQNQWGIVVEHESSYLPGYSSDFIFLDPKNNFGTGPGLVFGDGSTPTYFADTNVNIYFPGLGFTGNNLIEVKNYTEFTLGTKYDGDPPTTERYVNFNYFYLNSPYALKGDINGVVNLYGCNINAYSYGRGIKIQKGCIYNSALGVILAGGGPDFKMENVMFNGNSYMLNGVVGTMNNLVIKTQFYILKHFGATPVTYRNLYARVQRSGTHGIYMSAMAGDLSMIDTDTNTWHIFFQGNGDAKIIRQYTFNLKVIGQDNKPVGNAVVVLKDKDSNQVFTNTTYPNGTILEQIVSYGFYNKTGGDTIYSYSPHTLIISHPDYPLTDFTFNLTDRVNWLISLGNMSEEGNVSYPTNLSNISVKSVVHINDWVTARVQLKNTLGFYLEGQDCSVIVYEANSSNIVHDYDTLCMPGSAYIDRDGHWVSTSECRLTDSQGWYYFKGRIDEGLGFEYDESYDLVFTCNGQTKSVNFTTVLEKQPDVEKIEDLSHQYGGVFLFYMVISIILLLVVICLIMFIVYESQTNQ